MVFKRQVEGDITSFSKAKVALFSCPIDIAQTETKGTVLIKTADELMKFSKGEESLLESQIKAIADTGAKVVVSGGKFGDMALHFINKYQMMGVRLNSKFDLRRLAKTVGGTVRLVQIFAFYFNNDFLIDIFIYRYYRELCRLLLKNSDTSITSVLKNTVVLKLLFSATKDPNLE